MGKIQSLFDNLQKLPQLYQKYQLNYVFNVVEIQINVITQILVNRILNISVILE